MPASQHPRRHAAIATPSYPVLLRRLIASIRAERPRLHAGAALLQCLRSARLLFFRQEFKEFLSLRQREIDSADPALEFLSCLRYRHYLSKRLTLRQRVAGMLHHARYENRHHLDAYRTAIDDGRGLELWRAVVDGVSYCIRLVAAHDNAFEGQLSAVLFVNEQRICVMSFSYVDAKAFGLPSEPMLFITRNQTDAGSPEKSLFIQAFKQNMPAYFCLAAVSGVALAQGMTHIAAVTARAHVAFEARHTRSFDHSYGTFWQTFAARAVDDQAVLLPVPLVLASIDAVSSKHRSRARARRRQWQDVRRSAWSAMRVFLRPDSPRLNDLLNPASRASAAMSFGM